jgi:hypothetical protein
VNISGNYDNRVGSSDAASQGAIGEALLRSRPIARPGAVLEFVPGVAVTQHAGEGKANQYFLRGFNLDHGTDFAVRINGVPVNLPSHGHGQGYADMNFLIPELVQRVQYRKGPYDAHNGDFSAAGGADIVYRRTVAAPFIDVTLGPDRHRRLVGVAGLGAKGEPGTWRGLGAVEVAGHDGPWTVPERLKKRNAVLTLSKADQQDSLMLSLMAYRVSWVSTDQIPQRAVDQGLIGRFDSLDPTAGGDSRRSSLSGEWLRVQGDTRTRLGAWLLSYSLDLNSNFTYALERPADGDQFKQTDARHALGLEFSRRTAMDLGSLPATVEWGAQWRQDRIRVGLHDSVARVITNTVREDKLRQTQAAAYVHSDVALSERLRGVFGLRADAMRATVDALTLPANGGKASDSLLSPKASLIAGPYLFGQNKVKTEFFFNAGRGFHSNDARGGTARIDPKTGDPVDRVPLLVPATGIELGLRMEPLPGMQTSVALWGLKFDSELVYVGDAGATEASGASRRRGIEINNRWSPKPWLSIDADLALSHARFDNGDRVPNSVDKVALLGVTLRELGPWSATVQWRHLGSGALIEDNSVRSIPSTTVSLRVAHRFSERLEATLDVFNLLNRKNNDIQYFYESQLPSEAAAVADRHFHPAQPRAVHVGLRASF